MLIIYEFGNKVAELFMCLFSQCHGWIILQKLEEKTFLLETTGY